MTKKKTPATALPDPSFYNPENDGKAGLKQPVPTSAASKKAAKPKGETLAPTVNAAPLTTAQPDLTADLALAPHGHDMSPEEALARDIERIRSLAQPFGTLTQKLAVPSIPGYSQHWFNDEPGRVDEAKRSGWANVEDEQGSPVKRIVGRGRDSKGLYAYLMKIPSVFREEAMSRRHHEAQERMDEIKRSPVSDPKGMGKASDSEKFYTPGKGVVIDTRTHKN